MLLALLHYLQYHFDIKCHTSMYDRVTYQLLKSSTGVGPIYFFNPSVKTDCEPSATEHGRKQRFRMKSQLQSAGAWRASRAAES